MKRVLFLANHFVTLYSFRKELIRKLLQRGHEVILSLPPSKDNSFFEEMGCTIVETKIDRRGVNPFKDIFLIAKYKALVKRIKPDVVLSYTIKPNIYGTIATNHYGVKQLCNITGTGATFLKKSFLSSLCIGLYRKTIKKCYKVFFQNTGDKDFFLNNKMVGDNFEVLPGSGCNLDEHKLSPMPNTNEINIIFVGRVMKLKGIDEYLGAAKYIKEHYPNVNFIIAGWNEDKKYKAVVQDYQNNGYVRYIGYRKDVDEWIKKSHCLILPSHGGEGIPNVLLEAAALGRVCIGSRTNGIVDVIQDGKNGYLFESGNCDDLIKKIELFLSLTYEQKQSMGIFGHSIVASKFNREIVIDKYIQEVENE